VLSSGNSRRLAIFPDGTRLDTDLVSGKISCLKSGRALVEFDAASGHVEIRLNDRGRIRVGNKSVKVSLRGGGDLIFDRRASRIFFGNFNFDLKMGGFSATDDERNDFRFDGKNLSVKILAAPDLPGTPRSLAPGILTPAQDFPAPGKPAEARLFAIYRSGDSEEILGGRDFQVQPGKITYLVKPGSLMAGAALPEPRLPLTLLSRKQRAVATDSPAQVDPRFSRCRILTEYPACTPTPGAGGDRAGLTAAALRRAQGRLAPRQTFADLFALAPQPVVAETELKDTVLEETVLTETVSVRKSDFQKVKKFLEGKMTQPKPREDSENFWVSQGGENFNGILAKVEKKKFPTLPFLAEKTPWDPPFISVIPQPAPPPEPISPTREPTEPISRSKPKKPAHVPFKVDIPPTQLPGPHPSKRGAAFDLYGRLRPRTLQKPQVLIELNARFIEVESAVDRRLRTSSLINTRGNRFSIAQEAAADFQVIRDLIGLEGENRILEIFPTTGRFGQIPVGRVFRMTFAVRNLDADVTRLTARVEGGRGAAKVVFGPGPVAPGMTCIFGVDISRDSPGGVSAVLLISSKGNIARIPITAEVGFGGLEISGKIQDALPPVKMFSGVREIVKRVISDAN